MIKLTGANGFVGQNLMIYLRNYNLECSVISRKELNNLDFKMLNKSSSIIHLAGKAHDLKSVSASKEYYQINYELTKNLYDAFLVSDVKKFIFVSSVKAVADSVEGNLTEDISPNPLTHYGKSKLMAEEYIQSRSLPEGKSFYILRPCMIHGPGNKGNLNLLYKFVQKGIPYPLASFENRRSYLSVDNLCFVIRELILQDIQSGIYNVADAEPLSTNMVVQLLAEASHKKPKLWRIPIIMIKILATLGNMVNLPLNSERLKKMTESYVVSNQKVIRALGKDLPLKSIEGLLKTANSFKLN